MTDLTYKKTGLFTVFFPESKAGEEAYKEILANTEGTAKIYTMHLKSVLSNLRNAGYSVKKAPKVTMADEQLFAEMELAGF